MLKRLSVENCASIYAVRTARLVPQAEDPSEDTHEGLVCACVFVCRGYNLSAVQDRLRATSVPLIRPIPLYRPLSLYLCHF